MAKKKSTETIRPEIKGLYLLSFSLVAFVSLLSYSYSTKSQNMLGLIGFSLGWILNKMLGLSSYLVIAFIFWIGFRLLFRNSVNSIKLKSLYALAIVVSTSMLLTIVDQEMPKTENFIRFLFYPALTTHDHLGGTVLYYLYTELPFLNLSRTLNHVGVFILFFSTLLAGCLLLFKISPVAVYEKLKRIWVWPKFSDKPMVEVKTSPLPAASTVIKREVKLPSQKIEKEDDEEEDDQEEIKTAPKKERKLPPIKKEVILAPKESKIQESKPRAAKEADKPLPVSQLKNYELPSAQLLTNPKKVDSSNLEKNLNRQAEILEETLFSFGIEAKVGQINCGPTITSFEVHPSVGVKVQKIKTLEDDIALNMEAKTIRIIAPIPGKAAVGIEVPNPQPQEVSFKEILLAYQQGPSRMKIPVLLGKAVNGENVFSDLTKMPHCIIAGATGSGKSVCINTIVMSIVMNARPDQIRLLMVDPKKVELTPYTRLPHMLAPVITEPKEACLALNWLVKEMEKRYEILKLLGIRNIEAFNSRKPDVALEKSLDIAIPETMPYFVGIIDELADLMMVSASDIETPIARIAQMARAVGIHLILATQRPSREVITGLIKANFPTRIAFKVASRVNSQIILDEIGAECLLGNGDMLFLPPGSSHLIRAQGAYIRDEDINAVIKICQDQAPPNYLIQSFHTFEMDTRDDSGPTDELYDQAKEIVLSTGNASTTFLQRKLKVGYARAASLIDELEARGIVGPQEGAKARKILAPRMNSKQNDDDLFGDFD